MILFLTSSPTGPFDGSRVVDGLDPYNHFPENLHKVSKDFMRALIIASNPYDYENNDHMCDFFREAFQKDGFFFETFDLSDDRYIFNKEEIETYDMIILAGGHTPTENEFFHRIHLKECLADYQGIVIGISAGSMNMAKTVYFQPELEGESGEDFPRFGEGLGLTNINIVPHYQLIKDNMLDGKRLFEDIIYKDSYSHPIYLLEDGSYISNFDGSLKLYGKSYLLKDGKLELLTFNDGVVLLKQNVIEYCVED